MNIPNSLWKPVGDRGVFGDDVEDELEKIDGLCKEHLGKALNDCVTVDTESLNTTKEVAELQDLWDEGNKTIKTFPAAGDGYFFDYILVKDGDELILMSDWDGIIWAVK